MSRRRTRSSCLQRPRRGRRATPDAGERPFATIDVSYAGVSALRVGARPLANFLIVIDYRLQMYGSFVSDVLDSAL